MASSAGGMDIGKSPARLGEDMKETIDPASLSLIPGAKAGFGLDCGGVNRSGGEVHASLSLLRTDGRVVLEINPFPSQRWAPDRTRAKVNLTITRSSAQRVSRLTRLTRRALEMKLRI